MPSARRYTLHKLARVMLLLCGISLLAWLLVSESFRGFCREVVRLSGRFLSG